MRENRISRKYLLIYTILFAVLCFLVFLPFFLSGKGMVGKGDGQSQYILQLEYMGRYLRECFSGMLRGDFIPRRYDFTIGMGDDISCIVRFHPLDFLSVFVPSAYTEALYHVLIFLRLYLAGLAFSAFIFAWRRGFLPAGKQAGCVSWGVLAGCMVYLFNGYTFSLGIVHPIYLSPLITLPLLLYGAERIMNEPGRYRFALFTAMTALGFVSNYYFMYIESIALAIYVMIRFFQVHAGRMISQKMKALAALFFSMAAAYLAGLMLSAVTLFPVISRYLSSYRSERISEVNNLLVYADRRRYIAWLINLISPLRASGNGTHLNYAVIVLPALYLLFARSRKQDQTARASSARQFLRISAVAVLLCLLIPAGGYVMAVMNNENNRWVFLIALVVAGVVAFGWDDLLRMDAARKRGLLLLTGIFDLMILAECVIMKPDIYNITAAAELTLLTCMLVWIRPKKKENAVRLLLAVVMVSTVINGVMTYAKPFGNLVQYYMKAGTSLAAYRNSPYSNYLKVEDDSFYRVDGQFSGNNEDNAAVYLGYQGVQMYNSVLNRDEISALLQTGNPGLTTMLHIHSLDGHTPMSALSSVRYYLTSRKNSDAVPSGYAQESIWTDGKFSIRENLYPTSLTFGQTEVLPLSEAKKLNPVELEYAMLHAAVVEDARVVPGTGVLSAEDVRERGAVESVRIDLPGEASGIKRTKTGYRVKDTDASLTLEIPVRAGTECYLLFEGLKTEKSEKMKIRSDGISKSVTLLDNQAQYTMGRSDYAVRIGRSSEDGTREIRIRFTEKGAVDLAALSVVYAKEEDTVTAMKALTGDRAQCEFGEDEVRIRLSSEESRMQVFSIPYSLGWKAEVDGRSTDVICTDLCFLSVFLEEGDHEILLTYHSPGFKIGVWTSMGGILVILLLAAIRYAVLKARSASDRP